ncbi:hypothetical protein BN1048_01725 [Jeotgalicoccus saudimassiliensis]|uniref:Uncharacterized protein n=1 Tax=Jeotgalicoccus saudimassiliensis TaxID=1461582 RepID=A0A078MAK7_9STAP|nr:hypothetical protein [Jeotgalicoccus saudimassiliensis]CEA02467.1 hypothetical protein BN1048_01725 [Jeotgalicoccus saudimassiliensis]
MSVKENETNISKETPKEVKEIETLDFGNSGMVCDFETGMCGPIKVEKEDNK